MIKEDTIHIACASDDNYALLLAALIKSIIYNHHTDENIVFYIFSDGISKINQEKVNLLIVNSPEVEFKWLEFTEVIPKSTQFPIDNSTFPPAASLRLFAPHVLNDEVKKLIYLDVDMIVENDVSELWKTDLKGYTIGAVTDACKTVDCEWAGIPNYKELGIPSKAKYFNSGLLVINVDKWKSEKVQQRVFDVMKVNTKHLFFPDQYGLNVVFSEKWIELDPLWNWFAHNYHPEPKIIHFTQIKPIFKSYKSEEKFKKIFFKYLELTPWKGTPLRSNNKRLLHKFILRFKKYFKQRL
ncbi:MAG: glycosyltransferase family 8 protein [Bacteroidetes bacterium]|nr:glycosyltransferase family 8 protein [Bacteroidota bacterium]MBU1484061.1 glycosyltransferase family 8 protein [Bacteroidota bacterium]MBU2268875.1 glycosyltransferase family 8 protein [Bacteroidota bacterium]MBU2374778.1 glycosyltransferase family 8 protein [Bacteroidota bacterium]